MAVAPDGLLIAKLINLRVNLLAEGGFRLNAPQKSGAIVFSVLPGAEFAARLTLLSHDRHLGQLFYPTGRPLSAVVNLQNPSRFSDFMHNVDCTIFGDYTALPLEIINLINAVVSTDDQKVRSMVERIYDNGKEVDIAAPETWSPPTELLLLSHLCRNSSDKDCRRAAKDLNEILLAGCAKAKRFDPRRSLIRWNAQVDRWLHQAYGRRVTKINVDEDRYWMSLSTIPAVTAASLSMGLPQNAILRDLQKQPDEPVTGPMSDKEIRESLAGLHFRSSRFPSDPHFPAAFRKSLFLLVEKGKLSAVAHLSEDETQLYFAQEASHLKGSDTMDEALTVLNDRVIGKDNSHLPKP